MLYYIDWLCICVRTLADSGLRIKDIVEMVRKQRSGMVQTEAQYKFLYDVIPYIIKAQNAVSICLVFTAYLLLYWLMRKPITLHALKAIIHCTSFPVASP